MCAKIGQQQADNRNVFTQNLANHLNTFLNSLEEANKNRLTSVIEAENSVKRHAPRPLPKMEKLNNKQHYPRPLPTRNSSAVAGEEKPLGNKRKRPSKRSKCVASVCQIMGNVAQTLMKMMIIREK